VSLRILKQPTEGWLLFCFFTAALLLLTGFITALLHALLQLYRSFTAVLLQLYCSFTQGLLAKTYWTMGKVNAIAYLFLSAPLSRSSYHFHSVSLSRS
jgi:uncharacterized membrane protein